MEQSVKQQLQAKQVIRKLKCITIISLIFMGVQIVGGILAHSIAILADAFHLFTDVIAYVISLYAVLLSLRRYPSYLSFGYQKVQPLGAVINVGLIWVVTMQLIYHSTERIFTQQKVQQPLYMLLTSIFGLCCNLYIMKVLHSSGEHNHHNCSHSHQVSTDNTRASRDPQLNQKKEMDLIPKNKPNSSLFQTDNIVDEKINKEPEYDPDIIQPEIFQDSKHLTHSLVKNNTNLYENHDNDQNRHNGHNGHNHQQHQHSHTCSHNHHHDISDLEIDVVDGRRNNRFDNINLQAAHIHILSDIILSIGVIISALIIYFNSTEQWNYWQLADPFCTYLFSVMALYSTIPILKESIVILLDGCPDEQMKQKIITQVSKYGDINDIKIWALNRKQYYSILKILPNTSFNQAHIRNIFKQNNIQVTIEIINQ